MDSGQPVGAGMRAITISREYGCGGGEVAGRLARRLGWRLVDHEVVVQVAKALGVTEAEVATYDEHTEGLVARLLRGMQPLAQVAPIVPTGAPARQDDGLAEYRAALHMVVESAVREGNAVIVGRGAQVLLGNRRDVLHTRLVAPLDKRIAYVAAREGVDSTRAKARIALKDHDRARYLQVNYQRLPSDSHLYDLIVNTGVLGLDDAVELLALALQQKAQRLALSDAELGPGAGLPRYPGAPGDLRSPEPIAAATTSEDE